ncbi:uncharacterized protein [Watersipora subatra]|uniref:uncharacterized protein n=1 Tax=Watersipora subatra TaxID=2589382 RepID=UPI00355B3D82
MEHTLKPSTDTINGCWETCDSYYSNKGRVRESVSMKEMTIKSAKQGHRPEDHLSKAERRKLKKLKRHREAAVETEEDVSSAFSSSYECHVIYGTPTDGRILKKSYTKGFLKCKEKGHIDTSGCAKRFLSRPVYSDEDVFLCADDNVCGAETYENSISQPLTASLSDLITMSTNQKRHRTRKCSNTSTDSQSSLSSTISLDSSIVTDGKGKVTYIDRPVVQHMSSFRTQAKKALTPIKPFSPEYSEISIKPCDVDMETLKLNFGDNYREAYSKPRTFTLDFSDHLEPSDKSNRLYLVMVHKAVGKDFDKYRIYCTGTCLKSGSATIPTVQENNVFDLVSLESLVLSCWGTGKTAGPSIPIQKSASAHTITTKSRLGLVVAPHWNVSSSDMSELAQQAISSQYKMLKNGCQSDRTAVPNTSNQLQQSLQCGICFEELNDKALHSALLSCHHYFCNDCWSVHLTTAVKSGLVHITCPEYECKKEVDSVFLMSMLEFSTYCLHEMHVAEYSLFRNKQAVWCPTKGCSKLLHCDAELATSDEPITASCTCGAQCCFRCLKEPHWPLSCDQLTNYHEVLRKHGFSELIDSKTLPATSVSTRKCPRCRTPLAKNGGCSHMICCKCSAAFCWKCLQEFLPGEYMHRTCQPANFTMGKVSFKYDLDLHHRANNQQLADACKHRMYKSTRCQKELKELCKQLIDSTSGKHQLIIQSDFRNQSLRRYLQQVVYQMLASHNLLDYCCAVNIFKQGPKSCVPLISRLSYSLDVLERQLASLTCNQATVDKITKYYGIVKSDTLMLVFSMSQALSLVTPLATV